MRLASDNTTVTGNVFTSTKFKIGNQQLAMKILRDRLYTNIRRVIVQEYISNARDAHREAGCPSTPILIDAPGKLSPTLRIRDYGPGISPERVENVFVNYCVSTKNGQGDYAVDDGMQQTGGFGIGAKCAAAYTNAYNIRTWNGGKKYEYLVHKDADDLLTLTTISVSDSTEKSGTEVEIPIRPEDFDEVGLWCKALTEFWDVSPRLRVGAGPLFPTPEVTSPTGNLTLSTSGMVRTLSSIKTEQRHYNAPSVLIVAVDGIPYEYSMALPFERTSYKTIAIKLPLGAVELAANRESIRKCDENDSIISAALKSEYAQTVEYYRQYCASMPIKEFTAVAQEIRFFILGHVKEVKFSDLSLPIPIPSIRSYNCCRESRGYGSSKKYVLSDWCTKPARPYTLQDMVNGRVVYFFNEGDSLDYIKQTVREGGPARHNDITVAISTTEQQEQFPRLGDHIIRVGPRVKTPRASTEAETVRVYDFCASHLAPATMKPLSGLKYRKAVIIGESGDITLQYSGKRVTLPRATGRFIQAGAVSLPDIEGVRENRLKLTAGLFELPVERMQQYQDAHTLLTLCGSTCDDLARVMYAYFSVANIDPNYRAHVTQALHTRYSFFKSDDFAKLLAPLQFALTDNTASLTVFYEYFKAQASKHPAFISMERYTDFDDSHKFFDLAAYMLPNIPTLPFMAPKKAQETAA